MTVYLLAAVALAGPAGWYAHRWHTRALVAVLLAVIGQQQASLTAIPAGEVEHRAEVAAWHRARLDEQVARIDTYYLDQRADAVVVPLPVAPTQWRAAA